MFDSFSTRKRLKELEEAFQKLKGDFQSLELTWMDTQHKLKSILGRVVKSEALEREREDQMNERPPQAGSHSSGVPANGAPHGFLTENQKRIQQDILRRRSGLR